MQIKKTSFKLKKCHFITTSRIVLGHVFSSKEIKVDKFNVEVILKLPLSKIVREIRFFLGHVGFYRRFIKDFSVISRPLYDLLIKDTLF